MENTQRQYWASYRHALGIMQHGRLQAGVDRCKLLELLLANVAEFGSIEKFPHKLQLINEALQIAKQIRENYGPEQPMALIRIERLIWRMSAAKIVIEEQVAEPQIAGSRGEESEGEEFVDAIASQEDPSDVSAFESSQQSTSSGSDIGLPANVVVSGGSRRKGIPLRANKKSDLDTPPTSDQAEADAEAKDE